MIITVANLKGGTAKTTTALALALASAEDSERVCVLDCDTQGTACAWADKALERGESLPFEVESANIQTLRRLDRMRKSIDGFVFIDCPPAGDVISEAINIADLVIVPTASSDIDRAQTEQVVKQLELINKNYIVLIVKDEKNTIASKALKTWLKEHNIKTFNHTIPKREASNRSFGRAPANIEEYTAVYAELKGL